MISHPERHEQELAVFNSRHDAGALAIRAWLYGRRDDLNSKWPGLSGEELTRLQGEAQGVARLIKLIEHGPAIKKIERVQT